MGERKFTPGPWAACHKGECTCKMVWSGPADHPVAKVEAGEWGDTYPDIKNGKLVLSSIPYGEINEDVAIANANLISAAPELLEELGQHCSRCSSNGEERLLNMAKDCKNCSTNAVIKKALGECDE